MRNVMEVTCHEFSCLKLKRDFVRVNLEVSTHDLAISALKRAENFKEYKVGREMRHCDGRKFTGRLKCWLTRMNGWMNEWMAELQTNLERLTLTWMNEWMSGWMNEWMKEWMNEWMKEWMNEWMKEWMSEWKNEWMSEWKNDEWMTDLNEWMNEWLTDWLTDLNEWVNEWMTD